MNPRELHASLLEKGREKARTAAYASTTERLRKEVRAKWIVHHLNAGATVAKASELALLEPEYIEACRTAEAAQESAGVASVEYEAAEAYVRVWQTLEASKRAEMSLR